MNIGEKIKLYRKKSGLTQKQLAEKIGRKEITIRKYESGEREPRISIIHDICEALNIPIDEFGEELFEINKKRSERLEELRQKPFKIFNEYESNPIKKSVDKINLINNLLMIYGYKIEYYSGVGSSEEEAERHAEAINDNIAPCANIINLKTKDEFEIMLKDLTNFYDNFENFFEFEMFKLKNNSDN